MRGGAYTIIEGKTMKSKVIRLCIFELLTTVIFASSICKTHYGKFRDCTCGIQYRDVETRCCRGLAGCAIPLVRTENVTCPLTCLNGGLNLFDTSSKIGCRCSRNYGGACCEKGKEGWAACKNLQGWNCVVVTVTHGHDSGQQIRPMGLQDTGNFILSYAVYSYTYDDPL